MATNDKVKTLVENDVWVFTKQSTDFDNAYRIAKLFSEMNESQKAEYNKYFSKNYEKYGIRVDNYRTTVIPQLFGLITKTPFNSKNPYQTENVTAVFDLLNSVEFGGKEYNTFKSEQLLKIKIRAIIDTADNNIDTSILPIIFSFCTLRGLKQKFGIDKVSYDKFYTYVATCKDFSEIDQAIDFVAKGDVADASLINRWADRSRIKPLVQGNINLFIFERDSIKLNPIFEEYFQNEFIEKIDLDELVIQLNRNVDYSYFLYNNQGFDVNLIDVPMGTFHQPIEMVEPKKRAKRTVEVSPTEIEDDDSDYIEKVDCIKVYNINEDVAVDAHTVKPSVTTTGRVKRYSKNPTLGKIAIKRAGFKCMDNSEHWSFVSPKTNGLFMEAHHLIPIAQLETMWDKFGVNIDCTENLVSLCPTCHRAIHYGTKETKKAMLSKLFDMKMQCYKKIGLNIVLDELIKMY